MPHNKNAATARSKLRAATAHTTLLGVALTIATLLWLTPPAMAEVGFPNTDRPGGGC